MRRQLRAPDALKLLENVTDSVAVLNAEWRFVYVNAAAAALLRRPKEQVAGTSLWDALPGLIATDAYAQLQRAMDKREKVSFEHLYEPLGRFLCVRAEPSGDDLLLFVRDVTARKHEEQERMVLLRRAQDAVEHSQWAQNELKRSNEELRRANRDLETFAYSASHDLQEPLRNVAIFAQLLERKTGAQLDAEGLGFLEGILAGTRRMENLVQDLLAYSRATRQAEGPIPVIGAQDALERVMERMTKRIEQSGTVVTFGDLPQVSMHPGHLEQLFHHLLSNAMKYQDRRRAAAPCIHISAEQREGWWVISAADNGIGVDAKYWTQIFGLFKRLHSRSEYPGSGVGLAICQRVVEQYGGRIWLESSAPGQGSVFSFAIPDRRIE